MPPGGPGWGQELLGPSPPGPEGWGGMRLGWAGFALAGTEMAAEATILASTQQLPQHSPQGRPGMNGFKGEKGEPGDVSIGFGARVSILQEVDRARLGHPAPRIAWLEQPRVPRLVFRRLLLRGLVV